MGVESWSRTAADNSAPPPNGAPEGMAPSAVNDVIRQNMADIRAQFEDAAWFNWGHVPTRVDADTFTVAGDVSAIYTVGRRLRVAGGSTGFCTVASVSYSAPNTTVNVTMDSGSLPSPLTTVAASIIPSVNTPLPGLGSGFAALSSPNTFTANQLVEYSSTGVVQLGAVNAATTPLATTQLYIGNGALNFANWVISDASRSSPLVTGGPASGASVFFGASSLLPISFGNGGAERLRIDTSGAIRVNETLQVRGLQVPTGGAGLEVLYNPLSQLGYIQTYDRTAGAWHDTGVLGRNITLTPNAGGIVTVNASALYVGANTVFHTGNDGAGSGLDADTVDGLQASAFALASHTHIIANITGLQAALDGKQNAGSYAAAVHTHTADQVTNFVGRVGVGRTLSTSAPSGGTDGDIWYRY